MRSRILFSSVPTLFPCPLSAEGFDSPRSQKPLPRGEGGKFETHCPPLSIVPAIKSADNRDHLRLFLRRFNFSHFSSFHEISEHWYLSLFKRSSSPSSHPGDPMVKLFPRYFHLLCFHLLLRSPSLFRRGRMVFVSPLPSHLSLSKSFFPPPPLPTASKDQEP